MAGLDLGFLEFFSPVFSFLLIFAVVYAILDKFKIMGDNRALKAVAAFSIGVLFLFSEPARRFIDLTTPWFPVLLVGVLALLMVFMFIGASESDLANAVKDAKVYWSIIVVGLLLFTIALIQVIETTDTEAVADAQGSEFAPGERTGEGISALVHPRVLGAIMLLVIAAFAVRLISEGQS